MNLTETSLFKVAKLQYVYKLKVNSGLLFPMLIILQLFGVFVSISDSIGTVATDGSFVACMVLHYCSDKWVPCCTIFWIFAIAVTCSTKANRNMDFAYVSTRLSSNISSIVFLLSASIIGGITASLSAGLGRIFALFNYGGSNIVRENFFLPAGYIIESIVIETCLLFLISSIGYFIGNLVQVSESFKLFVLINVWLLLLYSLLSSLFGGVRAFLSIVIETFSWLQLQLATGLFAHLGVGLFWTILIPAILFGSATLLSNMLEVRDEHK